MVAISYGASSVVITDIDDGRLALAKECGVHHAVNVRSANDGEERKWRSIWVCVTGVWRWTIITLWTFVCRNLCIGAWEFMQPKDGKCRKRVRFPWLWCQYSGITAREVSKKIYFNGVNASQHNLIFLFIIHPHYRGLSPAEAREKVLAALGQEPDASMECTGVGSSIETAITVGVPITDWLNYRKADCRRPVRAESWFLWAWPRPDAIYPF